MAYVIKRYVKYYPDKTGFSYNLPALFTHDGLLTSYLRFLVSKSRLSQSWIERDVYSVKLLIEYLNANEGVYKSTTELLRSFTSCLASGTIDLNGNDESGLFWIPRLDRDTASVLNHITQYCDFIDIASGNDAPKINPFHKATNIEERLNWCSFYHKQANVFLNHLADSGAISKAMAQAREIQTRKVSFIDTEPAVRFPENKFDDLINKGCVKKVNKNVSGVDIVVEAPDYELQLIIMLMHYGGLRSCEVIQIYLSDISIDTKNIEAIVSVFHPSQGQSPDPAFQNRKEYLRTYGLLPRNEYRKSLTIHSGWKNPRLTNRNFSFDVFFSPPDSAQAFLLTLKLYLETSQRKKLNGKSHPFLFSNDSGEPETRKNFIRKYNNALWRIGLKPGKYLGHSPHSHRHAYGYRLKNYGLDEVDISLALHHKSPKSCLVYTQPTSEEIRGKMRGLIGGGDD